MNLADVQISAQQVNAPNVSLSSVPSIAIHALLYFAGALSVIFVVVGALKYTTSAGDPQRLSSAKNTILWALIGLAISASAFVIVAYVVKSL